MAPSTPRVIDVTKIVGMAEIAQRTKTSPHAVWNWTRRHENFPKPIATVSGRPAWDWDEIEAWNSAWTRSRGGYHTHAARTAPVKKATKAVAKKPAKKAAPKKPAAKKAPAKKKAAPTMGKVIREKAAVGRRVVRRPAAK